MLLVVAAVCASVAAPLSGSCSGSLECSTASRLRRSVTHPARGVLLVARCVSPASPLWGSVTHSVRECECQRLRCERSERACVLVSVSEGALLLHQGERLSECELLGSVSVSVSVSVCVSVSVSVSRACAWV